ncbi:MAG TPA: helix-turn-helix domain-containing protein [Caulobacteraceae bacterium]|nr:helix-turn-helix domain-containing protein [Caulobacteraceae bacterium]
MEAWRFSTADFEARERGGAWREAMHRLGLPVGELPDGEPPQAAVTSLASPLGIIFALVDAGPQTISGRRTDQPASVWLATLLEGEAVLEAEGVTRALAPGDIAFGPTGRTASLALETRCRLMFVQAPRVALDHRLVAARNLKIGSLSGREGVARVFSSLLRAIADALPELSEEQLRPVELALTEFLAASLAEVSDYRAIGMGAHSPHLHRICQSIETLLPDPELSLRRLAVRNGVSPRYIQKLFAAASETFGHYVRTRRLERCRTDLRSPMCARLSISEICFRWGFNESAHFSRAFRNQYGLSPRQYRRGEEIAAAPPTGGEAAPRLAEPSVADSKFACSVGRP